MKKVFSFIITLALCLSFSSCVTTAEAQTDGIYVSTNGVDFDVVLTYGTPIYNAECLLMYYIYRDLYYYPYYYSNRWYFRSYSRPLRHYRPVHRDFYRNRPPVHHNHGRGHGDIRHNRPNVNHRPNINNRPSVNHRPSVNSRPSGGIQRPQHSMRSSTMVQHQPNHSSAPRGMNNGGGRHFGGRR